MATWAITTGQPLEEGSTSAALQPPALPVAAVSAGALTMVALCFANGLQGAAGQTFAQVTDALKHAFHVNDATLGIVPFGVAVGGNLGAVGVAHFCSRHRRTAVLAAMFVLWGILIALAGLAPSYRVLPVAGVGFALFALFRIGSSLLEATDPAAYPLIADWWPVEDRARKVSIFNTVSAIGAFAGLIIAGVLVDQGLWRLAFIIWLPVALLGSALIRSRTEPPRGNQDAAYGARLENITEGAEHDMVVDVVEHPAAAVALMADGESPGKALWEALRAVSRLRTWRRAALGVAVAGFMGTAIMSWGLAYFKRTFGLSGTQAAGLAPVLGIGAFAGVLGGGFLADRLLARGMVRARLNVTAFGYGTAAVVYVAAFSTTTLWVAAPLLAVASGLATLPLGPQYAMMMDITPVPLRPQAAAALNILQASGAIGVLLVGVLSTLFGENLRLALLCVSPFCLLGAALVMTARHTYVADVAMVVATAGDPTEPSGESPTP